MNDYLITNVSGRVGLFEKQFVGDRKIPKLSVQVAVNRYFKKKDSNDFDKSTVWVTCVAWERTADKLEKMKVGDILSGFGDLECDVYKNKEGQNVKKYYVRLTKANVFSVPKANGNSDRDSGRESGRDSGGGYEGYRSDNNNNEAPF